MVLSKFFIYAPFVVALLAYCVFVLPCRLQARWRFLWLAALAVAFGKFFCFRLLGGNAFVPWLPEKLIWLWNWMYLWGCVLFVLSFALLPFRFRRKVLILPAVALAVSAWGVANGILPPEVKERVLEYADLPDGLDGYRIAHMTDLHVSSASRRWRTESVVDRINAARPDLVCITGDMMDGSPGRCRSFIEPLARLEARDGVYACTGNHEFYYYSEEWIRLYESWGIRFLRNGCAFPAPGLALGGVEDMAEDWRSGRKKVMPDVSAAFAAATGSCFRVLMEHRPENAAVNAARHGVRLQLSGHTHGGVMPLLALLVARYNGGYVRGIYELPGGGKLYVSPGAGQWAAFPARFFNPSEITILTLKKKRRQESHGKSIL
jgi:predicted MPP superfamily phosphohydrolase